MAKEKGLKGESKVSGEKALIIFIFILGLVLGTLLSVYALYPEMNKSVLEKAQETEQKNTLLERQVDAYVTCLNSNSIDPEECG